MLSLRPVRTFVLALLVALAAALLPPVPDARAAGRTVQGGRLDWGVKSSFLSYVTGPVAQGSWALTGGAATTGSQFRFHSATGSYDPGAGAFRAAFSGGVRFVGHRKADGSHGLDLTIARPTVRIGGGNSGSGTLHADMTSRTRGSGTFTTASQVPLATLDLSGTDVTVGGGPVSLTGVPATLTARGATAFAGYYPAGTPLDPVSLSVDVAAVDDAPDAPGKPREATPERSGRPGQDSGQDSRQDSRQGSGRRADEGGIRDAAVDWGVRRAYREYVTGPVAQGGWTLSDGALDGGALFRFPRGKGSYDVGKATLDAGFAGRVRFTGTGLDLTLSGVRVEVADGKGTLYADVVDSAEGSPPRDAVPVVTFEAEDFTPKNGLTALTEVPTKLTSQGARTFGTRYAPGTEMDPLSLAVVVGAGARLPALPDLGSDAKTPARPGATADAADTGGPDGSSPAPADAAAPPSSSPPGAWTYAAIGAGALAVAGAAAFVVRGRRRTEADTAASDGG
ncbi:HtaA domain-containing protein [Streptomyces hebeiensis]